MEDFLMYAVPTGVFAAFVAMAFAAVKRRNKTFGWGIVGVVAVFTLWMILAMTTAVGWDGLIYAIGLIFVAAPAGGGAIVGSIAGWVKRHNDQQHLAA